MHLRGLEKERHCSHRSRRTGQAHHVGIQQNQTRIVRVVASKIQIRLSIAIDEDARVEIPLIGAACAWRRRTYQCVATRIDKWTRWTRICGYADAARVVSEVQIKDAVAKGDGWSPG